MPRIEVTQMHNSAPETCFPTAAGVFLGLGLGGFFDGIVLHQILQWPRGAPCLEAPPRQ